MCSLLYLVSVSLVTAGEFTTSISGAYPEVVSAIATDSAGNTYVVGSRQLATFTVANASTGLQGGSDVFVAKLDPNGKVLFTDAFAGKGVDTGTAIALDPAGNIYIAGTTTSPDFPLTHAMQTQIFAGGPVSGVLAGTGFIMKLSNDGATILYSTYFGGTLGQSSITSLATDANGNLYLTGYTQASDFPHTAGMPFGKILQSPATPGAIIASISPAGDRILYSGVIAMATPCATSCISNGTQWEGVGIAVDAAGNAYIAGNDSSGTNLPTTAGVLTPKGIGAFVAKVNAGGTGLSYLTYIGSGQIGNPPLASPENTLYAIAVDPAGNAYLGGQTFDPNFPATPGSYQPSSSLRTPNGFLAKLNPTASAMVWATYFSEQVPRSIAIDSGGNVWATGATSLNSTFPNANGWSTGPEFLAELNATGSQLTYSALYPSGTIAQSAAVDPFGLVHVGGSAGFISAIAPTTAPAAKIFAFQNAAGAPVVTARISPAEVIAIYGPGIGPATAVSATPASGYYPTTLAGVQVAIDGVNIPLLYVSANQINAVVPIGLSSNAAHSVRVVKGISATPDYPVWTVASSPVAFAPVVNQDGSINSRSNPAPGGSIVTFYATGWQSNFSPLADGQVATVAQDACLGTCRAGASSGGMIPFGPQQLTLAATVLYGGAAPAFVAGVTQFNVQLGTVATPPSTGTFAFSLLLTSPAVTQTVTQAVWISL